MSIDVLVESEDGETVFHVADPLNRTLALCPADPDSEAQSCCLRFVDPYGDAVFNHLQIPHVAKELHLAADNARDPQIRAHAEAILRLIESVTDWTHTYLRFAGD